MIVTTGRHIRIEVGRNYLLERTSETPGGVRISDRGGLGVRRPEPGQIDLPASPEEAERFIAAYRRIIAEDVEYRKVESG